MIKNPDQGAKYELLISAGKYFSMLTGTLLIGFCLYQALNFPVANTVLIIGLIMAVIIQAKYAHAFLIYLPVCIVALDLTPWSGRFIFNEFDFLILCTVGTALVFKQIRTEIIWQKSIIIPLLLILLAFSTISLSSFWQSFNQPLLSNPYYLNLYHFKVAKGLLYGLLLAILFAGLYRQNAVKTTSHLICGACFASIILFFIILWERQSLLPILTLQPWWAIASSLLDFTSSYRVTSLLSDMHTGGEALDGVFLMLMPLNILGFYWFRSTSLRLLAVFSIFCLAYCVAVGFTRTTYFSIALIIIVHVGMHRWWSSKLQPFSIKRALCYVGIVLSSFIIFNLAGYSGFFAFSCIIISSYICRIIQLKYTWPSYFNLIIVIAISAIAASYAINHYFNSRWIEATQVGLILLVLTLVTTMLLTYVLLHQSNSKLANQLLIQASSLLGAALFVSITVGGYQINARMGTVSTDIQSRFLHWQSVMQSSGSSWADTLLGNGVGSFPQNYVMTFPEVVKKVGSFSIVDEHLVLGIGEDMAFGQRVPIKPNTDYEISIQLKAFESGSMAIFLCERNLIFASNFMANCANKRIYVKPEGENTTVTFTVNSKNVGKVTSPVMRWPTMIYIKNFHATNSLTINSIEFESAHDSENLLSNSDFSKGLDHWFFYNDFEHLPWHIKSLYLSVFYQLGLVGTLMFLVLISKVMLHKPADDHQLEFKIYLISYILGMLAFGLFGDPLDSAKASLYFFMTLFAWSLIGKNSKNHLVSPRAAARD